MTIFTIALITSIYSKIECYEQINLRSQIGQWTEIQYKDDKGITQEFGVGAYNTKSIKTKYITDLKIKINGQWVNCQPTNIPANDDGASAINYKIWTYQGAPRPGQLVRILPE